MIIIYDEWRGRKDEGATIEDPSWQCVLEHVEMLNGKTRTMLVLSTGERSQLIAAGPNQEGYLVNGTQDGIDFFSLKADTSLNYKVNCFIGGQDGEYSNSCFVSKLIAEKALRYYYETGAFCLELAWHKD